MTYLSTMFTRNNFLFINNWFDSKMKNKLNIKTVGFNVLIPASSAFSWTNIFWISPFSWGLFSSWSSNMGFNRLTLPLWTNSWFVYQKFSKKSTLGCSILVEMPIHQNQNYLRFRICVGNFIFEAVLMQFLCRYVNMCGVMSLIEWQFNVAQSIITYRVV